MENLIEHILGNFQEKALPKVTPRDTHLPQISGKIDVVVGMRRVGKTYLLYQVMQEKLQQGVTKDKILYFNFDDERIYPLSAKELHIIPETYYRMYPHNKSEKCYFYFDEIQNVPGWELFIRRLLDTENAHLYLTGSSSKLLSKEIATTLRGRSITTELFPFSFKEFLLHGNNIEEISRHPGSKARALFDNRIRKYLSIGGFPETLSLEDDYRIRILQEYVDIVILRDVIERYPVANAYALRVLARHLLSTPATLFSVNKYFNDLKSQGITTHKNALYEYLDYLHDAYLIFPVSIHHRSLRIQRTNPRKIYLIDSGLINAFLHQPQSDWGHLLENFVFIELRRRGLKVEYYRTKDGKEVDFISTSLKGEQTLYQVSLDLSNKTTYEREVNALKTAMEECHLKQGYIITLKEQNTIKFSTNRAKAEINIITAWQFALYI